MKYKKRRSLKLFAVAALLPMIPCAGVPQAAMGPKPLVAVVEKSAGVTEELTQMVREFLATVPKGDKRIFDDFFADDVIYTRSVGVTVGKSEILKNVEARPVDQPEATFDADGFTVHAYGDAAVVNFRLIMHNLNQGKTETTYFRNTGTFVRRNGKWQAVAWQATRVPVPEERS